MLRKTACSFTNVSYLRATPPSCSLLRADVPLVCGTLRSPGILGVWHAVCPLTTNFPYFIFVSFFLCHFSWRPTLSHYHLSFLPLLFFFHLPHPHISQLLESSRADYPTLDRNPAWSRCCTNAMECELGVVFLRHRGEDHLLLLLLLFVVSF